MGVQLLWILMRCIQIECSVQAFLVVLLVLAGGRRLISTRYFPFWGILDIRMAEKPPQPSGKALAGFNFVANDQVWKDHIRYEETASKRWPEYWGFLGGNYRDLVKDDFVKREVKKIELPPPLVLPPITPISRYIKVDPSPKPFPQTTAGKIGWRSSERQHSLEIYGSYARPKGGLINQLNWPPEGVL